MFTHRPRIRSWSTSHMKAEKCSSPPKRSVDQDRHWLEVTQRHNLAASFIQSRAMTSAVGSEIQINADKHSLQGKIV